MQQTLLVTLQGPQKRLDLALPKNVPLHNLLSLLVQLAGVSTSLGQWLISFQATGRPLRPELTLADNKVLDGDVLVLHKEGRSPETPPARRTGISSPITSRSPILITWEK